MFIVVVIIVIVVLDVAIVDSTVIVIMVSVIVVVLPFAFVRDGKTVEDYERTKSPKRTHNFHNANSFSHFHLLIFA